MCCPGAWNCFGKKFKKTPKNRSTQATDGSWARRRATHDTSNHDDSAQSTDSTGRRDAWLNGRSFHFGCPLLLSLWASPAQVAAHRWSPRIPPFSEVSQQEIRLQSIGEKSTGTRGTIHLLCRNLPTFQVRSSAFFCINKKFSPNRNRKANWGQIWFWLSLTGPAEETERSFRVRQWIYFLAATTPLSRHQSGHKIRNEDNSKLWRCVYKRPLALSGLFLQASRNRNTGAGSGQSRGGAVGLERRKEGS